VDIWSLGITCIELANNNPPLSDVHPFSAMMQIPMMDAPQLTGDKWSKKFRDFVKVFIATVSCLSVLLNEIYFTILYVAGRCFYLY